MKRALAASLIVLGLFQLQRSAAADYITEDLRIPFAAAGPRGLEATLIRPAGPQRYPLALISHGAPRDASDRPGMNPNRFHLQAVEFARRGFAALVVMRRGYGDSGGAFSENSGPCASPDYLRSARASADDLRAAVDAMSTRNDVTTTGMIAVGISAGGLASVAVGANPPAGLVAIINFAGGRGSPAPNQVCTEQRLVEAFGTMGKTSRIPELWIYAQNDQFFGPDLATKFHTAFTASGGVAEFIAAPAFGTDGHNLFVSGVTTWTPMVDQFLRARNLGLRELLAEPALPNLQPPPQLARRNLDQFTNYLKSGSHRAFAIAPEGAFGWRAGERNASDAISGALKTCGQYGTDCAIYAIDDRLAAP